MLIKEPMQAFWWFKDNSVAGMARPGFNAVRCGDLPFDEGILFGWLGQFSCGSAPLDSFRAHLTTYAPKVFPFFKMSPEAGRRALEIFDDVSGMQQVSVRLAERTKAFSSIQVDEREVRFRVCDARLGSEIEFLKKQGIRRVVTLTERHHHKEVLSEHFDVHHLGIEDLGAPRHEQVYELSEILKKSQLEREVVAVHCLAGIGRTSTMLMAAHMMMGHPYEELVSSLAERNPSFQLLGPQAAFIEAFRKG